MPGPPTVVAIRRPRALAFRTAVYDALFTGHRTTWLVRLILAVLMEAAGGASFGARTNGIDCTPGVTLFGMVLRLVPLVWLVFPLARLPSSVASPRTVSFLDEGVSVEGEACSLSFAWSSVRSVRRTLWDLVIVLDRSTIAVPRSSLPSGTVDSVLARFGAATTPSARAEPTSDGGARGFHAPYRTPETRPLGPEDEEASPREWVPPTEYRHSVLAFPTGGDHVRALFFLKLRPRLTPTALFVLGVLFLLLGTVGGADGAGELVRFTNVGLVLVVLSVASFVVEIAPSLFALRDRAVRERRAGVLYAIGAAGLYVRTHSFERRDPWKGALVRMNAHRIALFTQSLVHVIPLEAFDSEAARTKFVQALERQTRPTAADFSA